MKNRRCRSYLKGSVILNEGGIRRRTGVNPKVQKPEDREDSDEKDETRPGPYWQEVLPLSGRRLYYSPGARGIDTRIGSYKNEGYGDYDGTAGGRPI